MKNSISVFTVHEPWLLFHGMKWWLHWKHSKCNSSENLNYSMRWMKLFNYGHLYLLGVIQKYSWVFTLVLLRYFFTFIYWNISWKSKVQKRATAITETHFNYLLVAPVKLNIVNIKVDWYSKILILNPFINQCHYFILTWVFISPTPKNWPIPKYEYWAIYPLLSQAAYPSNMTDSWIGHSLTELGKKGTVLWSKSAVISKYQCKNYSKTFEAIMLYGESATNFISMNAAKMIILNIIYNWKYFKCQLPDQFEAPF